MSLKTWALSKVTSSILRGAAEGRMGPAVKAVYWFTQGHKTQIAAGFALAAGVVELAQQSGTCATFGINCTGWVDQAKHASEMVAAGLAYLGQVDGALHDEPPRA